MSKSELFAGMDGSLEGTESYEIYEFDNIEQCQSHEELYGIPLCENVIKEYVEICGDENSNEYLI